MLGHIFKKINNYLHRPVKNKHVKYGIPFFLFVGFGMLFLGQVGKVRYEFRKVKDLDREEMKRLGIKMKDRQKTLEEAYEEYTEKYDLDNWKNIRGPRLWDEEEVNN